MAVTVTEIGGLAALVALGLVAAGVAVWLGVGLFQARSLLRRELGAYFLSPLAYVVLVVFLIVTGILFWLTLDQLTALGPHGVDWPLQALLGNWPFWLVFLFIPMLLTVRLFAEERGSGTLEMLMTAPLRDWQVVLSKYVACLLFYAFLWLPTLAYLPVLLNLHDLRWQQAWTPWSVLLVAGAAAVLLALLSFVFRLATGLRAAALGLLAAGAVCAGVGAWGHYRFDAEHLLDVSAGIDPMPVLSSYLGLALAGAMFLALGMLVSSLVRSQVVAAIVTLPLSLLFIVPGLLGQFVLTDLDTGSTFYRVLYFFSVPLHFSKNFSRGLVDTRPLVLYSTVAVACVFLTVRSLESRRWQ